MKNENEKHEKAFEAVISLDDAPHNWIGAHWNGRGHEGCDSAWALVFSGLPLTIRSAERMLAAARAGKTIAGMQCIGL